MAALNINPYLDVMVDEMVDLGSELSPLEQWGYLMNVVRSWTTADRYVREALRKELASDDRTERDEKRIALLTGMLMDKPFNQDN
jgi:hypothetical protein